MPERSGRTPALPAAGGAERTVHLISAWAVEQRLVLGQRKVDAASNETRVLPELLALLTLDGRIVTADAMHGHKATAQAILDRGGEYCLALKANQPALLADVRLLLDDPEAQAGDRFATTDGDHGRIETRRSEIVHDVAWLAASHRCVTGARQGAGCPARSRTGVLRLGPGRLP